MLRSAATSVFILATMVLLMLMVPASLWAEDPPPEKPAQKGLQQRIDFGNAQILGQSIKSGAVYLMHRKKSDIKNMLEVRQHYREEIKEDFRLENTAIAKDTADTEKTLKK